MILTNTKLKITTLIIFLLLFINNSKAQKSTIDTIFWDNNNYTLVRELGKVWITENNGRIHKNVKINTIDKSTGKIEYYSEGTFHDVYISNIDRITPGKVYNSILTFSKHNVPSIDVEINSSGIIYENGSFKSHQPSASVEEEEIVSQEQKKITEEVVVEELEEEKPINYESAVFDRIIFNSGKTLDIKILSISNGEVHYKRSDILSGPVYIISLTIPGTMKKAKINQNLGQKIIDYRN